jgi:hypothetical protein
MVSAKKPPRRRRNETADPLRAATRVARGRTPSGGAQITLTLERRIPQRKGLTRRLGECALALAIGLIIGVSLYSLTRS